MDKVPLLYHSTAKSIFENMKTKIKSNTQSLWSHDKNCPANI